MAYEFIAAGIRPAKPLTSYFEGVRRGQDQRQNAEINKVNIDAAKTRNEAAGIELSRAKKQVDAEDQWSKLPRGEDGSLDPAAESQFKTAFPEYYDTRKKAEVAELSDRIGLAADRFTMSAKLFENAKSPEDIAKARKFAKDNFDMDIDYDPAVFGTVQQYSSELAQKSAMIQEDMAAAAAAGDYDTVQALKSALSAESTLAQLEVQKSQAAIARDQAAAAASRANAGKYAAQAAIGPLVQYLDEEGKAVFGTRNQALGKRPVPPAASLRDLIEQDKITDARARVSGNLDALNEYYTELSTLDAAIDTKKQGGPNVYAAVRASGVGQIAGRALGTKEQSARNKINQMRPLLLQEIRQASAMGARGLDSNKELEFYLQAATDPSRDTQANMAAMNVLSEAYGIGTTYGDADDSIIGELNNEFTGELPLVTSEAELAKIKPGVEYRDKFGKRWKKPK